MSHERIWSALRRWPVELYVLCAVGLVLRLYKIGEKSLWNDEFASMEDALALGPDVLVEQLRVGRPLYYLLLRLWIEVFGTGQVAMRSLSVLIGVAAIPVLYWLAHRLYGRETAFFATILLTFSRLHVRWSQDVRMYGLLALLATVSFYALVVYFERGTRRSRIAYAGSTAVLLYTHLFGVFAVIAQNLYAAVTWVKEEWRFTGGSPREWITTQLLVGVLVLPVILAILHHFITLVTGSGNTVGWLEAPPLFTPLTLAVEYVYMIYHPVPAVLVTIIVAYLLVNEMTADRDRRHWDVLLTVWIGTVVLLPFVLSYLLRPMFTIRYTIAALPAVLLLIGRSLENVYSGIDDTTRRRVFVVGLVALLLLPLAPYYTEPQREQWNEAAAFVEERVEPGDIVLVSKQYTSRNFEYYFDRDDVPVVGVPERANDTYLADRVRDADRVWMVMSNLQADDRMRLLRAMNATARPDGPDWKDARHRGLPTTPGMKVFYRVAVYRFVTDSAGHTDT